MSSVDPAGRPADSHREVKGLHPTRGWQGPMRRLVTFESEAFNTSEPRDYFINPNCFGDDVALRIIQELRDAGVEVENEPGQEDFGWDLTFQASGSHQLVLGYQPETDRSGTWIGWVERNVGLFGTMLGRRRRVAHNAAALIHQALLSVPEIANVRWHTQEAFDAGRESEGTPSP